MLSDVAHTRRGVQSHALDCRRRPQAGAGAAGSGHVAELSSFEQETRLFCWYVVYVISKGKDQ